MSILLASSRKLTHINGHDQGFESKFPDNFGLPKERSARSVRITKWVGNTAIAFAGGAAAFVLAVPTLFPQFLPDLRTQRAEPAKEQGLSVQLNHCRFDQQPCIRIHGLVAVETNGNSTGPAIQNPVVIRVGNEIEVVSNNLATEANPETHFEAWPADENLTLCRGDTEPEPQIVYLGNDTSTSRYRDSSTGTFSERLDPFAGDCQEWVNPNILNHALVLIESNRKPPSNK